MISYSLVTPPVALAVPLETMKAHLRVDGDTEDDLITSYIRGATSFCEGFTGRAFLTQTWKAVLPAFPLGSIPLARPPLQSVASAVYIDADGTSRTLASSVYSVDAASLVGSIRPTYGTTWPTTQPDTPNAVEITYVCGYGDEPTDLPYQATMAVKLMTAQFFEMREPVVMGSVNKVPLSVESLLYQLKVPEVA